MMSTPCLAISNCICVDSIPYHVDSFVLPALPSQSLVCLWFNHIQIYFVCFFQRELKLEHVEKTTTQFSPLFSMQIIHCMKCVEHSKCKHQQQKISDNVLLVSLNLLHYRHSTMLKRIQKRIHARALNMVFHTHTHTHARTQAHTHTRARAHTHTHTQHTSSILSLSLCLPLFLLKSYLMSLTGSHNFSLSTVCVRGHSNETQKRTEPYVTQAWRLLTTETFDHQGQVPRTLPSL